jgi:hypothetical protein
MQLLAVVYLRKELCCTSTARAKFPNAVARTHRVREGRAGMRPEANLGYAAKIQNDHDMEHDPRQALLMDSFRVKVAQDLHSPLLRYFVAVRNVSESSLKLPSAVSLPPSQSAPDSGIFCCQSLNV